MDLSDFQRKAILLIFISILAGSILIARKEPLKPLQEKEIPLQKQSVKPKIEETQTPVKIDINTADKPSIMQLPGIGPVFADEIINYRTNHGPFLTIQDLRNVPGIGEKRLARIKDFIDLPEGQAETKKEKLVEKKENSSLTLPSPRRGEEISSYPLPLGEGERSSGEGVKNTMYAYDSRIDPKVKCPYCGEQLWEPGRKKEKYIRCPHCMKLLE